MQPLDPQPVPTTCVASVQMAPAIGEVAANVARSIELAEEAAGQGARLVVLPELANTGYMFASREEAYALAEPVPEGPSSRAWIALAERLGIYLVAGIAERCGDRLYNSALIAGPQGYIGTYRKLHLWGDENLYFEAGDLGLPVFHTELGRLGVAICSTSIIARAAEKATAGASAARGFGAWVVHTASKKASVSDPNSKASRM